MVVIVLGSIKVDTNFNIRMENYKEAVIPFSVIKTLQSKHCFNLRCLSGSRFPHHVAALSLTLPTLGDQIFPLPHLFFLKFSPKFL